MMADAPGHQLVVAVPSAVPSMATGIDVCGPRTHIVCCPSMTTFNDIEPCCRLQQFDSGTDNTLSIEVNASSPAADNNTTTIAVVGGACHNNNNSLVCDVGHGGNCSSTSLSPVCPADSSCHYFVAAKVAHHRRQRRQQHEHEDDSDDTSSSGCDSSQHSDDSLFTKSMSPTGDLLHNNSASSSVSPPLVKPGAFLRHQLAMTSLTSTTKSGAVATVLAISPLKSSSTSSSEERLNEDVDDDCNKPVNIIDQPSTPRRHASAGVRSRPKKLPLPTPKEMGGGGGDKGAGSEPVTTDDSDCDSDDRGDFEVDDDDDDYYDDEGFVSFKFDDYPDSVFEAAIQDVKVMSLSSSSSSSHQGNDDDLHHEDRLTADTNSHLQDQSHPSANQQPRKASIHHPEELYYDRKMTASGHEDGNGSVKLARCPSYCCSKKHDMIPAMEKVMQPSTSS